MTDQWQKRKSFGYTVNPSTESEYEEELADSPTHPLLDKIKTKGYWEIHFKPIQEEKVELLQDWINAIDKAQVRKSRYFPFLPLTNDAKQGITRTNNFIAGFSQFGCRLEIWRAYKSGQFVLYQALTEDWYSEDEYWYELAKTIHSGKNVSIFNSIIHLITAAIEFAARLGSQDFFKSGIQMTFKLQNTAGRKLYTDTHDRYPLLHPRMTDADRITVKSENSKDDLMQNAIEISNKLIRQVFDVFGYNPPTNAILNDQKKIS